MKVIKMDYKEIAKNQTEHWERLAVKHAGTVSAVGGESMKHKYLRYEIIPLQGIRRKTYC